MLQRLIQPQSTHHAIKSQKDGRCFEEPATGLKWLVTAFIVASKLLGPTSRTGEYHRVPYSDAAVNAAQSKLAKTNCTPSTCNEYQCMRKLYIQLRSPVTSASLLVTSALLVVTMVAIRNNTILKSPFPSYTGELRSTTLCLISPALDRSGEPGQKQHRSTRPGGFVVPR